MVIRPSLSYLGSQSDCVHASLLNEYLLSTYYVPDTVLGPSDIGVGTINKSLYFQGVYITEEKKEKTSKMWACVCA